jgi:hypothetical protein
MGTDFQLMHSVFLLLAVRVNGSRVLYHEADTTRGMYSKILTDMREIG